MASLSAASKALWPSGPFRSLSAPYRGWRREGGRDEERSTLGMVVIAGSLGDASLPER